MKLSRMVLCVVLVLTAAALPAAFFDKVSMKAVDLGGSFAPRQAPMLGARAAQTVVIQPHDGSFEEGYAIEALGSELIEFSQHIQLPGPGGDLLAFEACFFSVLDLITNFEYDFVAYEVKSNGEPGDTIQIVKMQEPGFDLFPYVIGCNIIQFDGGGVEIDGDEVFIGVRYGEDRYPGVVSAVDTNDPSNGEGYGRVFDLRAEWFKLRDEPAFANFKNLGIRTAWKGEVEGQPPPSGDCVPSQETVCLRNGRFEVKVDWLAANGDSGEAKVVPGGTDETVNMYFSSSTNWELLLKVLDSCNKFDRFWVFIGGTTDLEVRVRIRDTVAGGTRTYNNPLGTPFLTVTDTNAFATCP